MAIITSSPETELATWNPSLSAVNDEVNNSRDRIVSRARDLVRLQYEKGAASLFEFLDAQRAFLATQLEYMQALNDYWSAAFQLEQATATESFK